MICSNCGNEFFSDHWNARFCDVRCKDNAMAKRRRERARMAAIGKDIPVTTRVKTGRALEEAVRDAEKLERQMRGEVDPNSSASIFAELYPKKKD